MFCRRPSSFSSCSPLPPPLLRTSSSSSPPSRSPTEPRISFPLDPIASASPIDYFTLGTPTPALTQAFCLCHFAFAFPSNGFPPVCRSIVKKIKCLRASIGPPGCGGRGGGDCLFVPHCFVLVWDCLFFAALSHDIRISLCYFFVVILLLYHNFLVSISLTLPPSLNTSFLPTHCPSLPPSLPISRILQLCWEVRGRYFLARCGDTRQVFLATAD